jgi:hypothetical protein
MGLWGMFWLHLYICAAADKPCLQETDCCPPQNKLSMRELNDHFLRAPVSL